MKTIVAKEFIEKPSYLDEAQKVLTKGGLVCIPCQNNYRILADLYNRDAVNRLFQSKRRTHKKPSLVFIGDIGMLRDVAENVPPLAAHLASTLWPGALTILFKASAELPNRTKKELIKANGKIGARIPHSPIARLLVERFGSPLLVSSANKEKKHGASSPAQIRKNFANKIDLFIDAGDLPQAEPSTVVDIDGEQLKVTRYGAIPRARIDAAIAAFSP